MKRIVKSPAHLIILLWAAAWAQFLIAEALAWHSVMSASVWWIALGVLFLLLALVPRKWEAQGGALLLTCGLGLLLAYQAFPPTQLRSGLQVLLFLLLALPPLTIGMVFLTGHLAHADLRVSTQRQQS